MIIMSSSVNTVLVWRMLNHEVKYVRTHINCFRDYFVSFLANSLIIVVEKGGSDSFNLYASLKFYLTFRHVAAYVVVVNVINIFQILSEQTNEVCVFSYSLTRKSKIVLR